MQVQNAARAIAKMTVGMTATAMRGPARPLLPLEEEDEGDEVDEAVGRLRGSKVVGFAGIFGGESSPSGMIGA